MSLNQTLSPLLYPGESLSTTEYPVIYSSSAMGRVMDMVSRVAPSDISVLILGESGTGKELLARSIHARSDRNQEPFVAINCGALPENLLESELFGHEKGAFTGAYTKKIGLAEVASGGVLFLDEIGELSPSIQGKILRFLQEGEIYRLGGKTPIHVDVRIVSATNKDLDEAVANGSFREDLYYRINTFSLEAPPLRRRREDIPLLLDYFLSHRSGGEPTLGTQFEISTEALEALVKYDWPGNVRELQNLCERLKVLVQGNRVEKEDIPEFISHPDLPDLVIGELYDPALTLRDMERRCVVQALKYFSGNKTRAANALGITVKTLYNKLHEYGTAQKYNSYATNKT